MSEDRKTLLQSATFQAHEAYGAQGKVPVVRNYGLERQHGRMDLADWLRCKQAWITDARYHDGICETMAEAADLLEDQADAIAEMLDIIAANKGNREPLYAKLREWRKRHKGVSSGLEGRRA